MDVTFRCPCCERTAARVELAPAARVLACPGCHAETELPGGAIADGGALRGCLVCPSKDLFLRKDFPQRLGVALVLLGFAGFLIANYFYHTYLAFGFLFATAALDILLYLVVGDALVCYRCGAHYRGVANLGEYSAFELETHEHIANSPPEWPQSGGRANGLALLGKLRGQLFGHADGPAPFDSPPSRLLNPRR